MTSCISNWSLLGIPAGADFRLLKAVVQRNVIEKLSQIVVSVSWAKDKNNNTVAYSISSWSCSEHWPTKICPDKTNRLQISDYNSPVHDPGSWVRSPPWPPAPYWLDRCHYNVTGWDRSHGLPALSRVWLLFVCLFGFLTSSSTTRLYRGRAPRQERLTILRAATHETELGDHDFCLSRSHYTDTDPTCRERAATAGIEPGTSSPGVARSTAELPRPPRVWQYV